MAAKLSSKAIGKKLQRQLLPAIEHGDSKQFYRPRIDATEKDIQSAILDYLARCSAIAWANRFTSGKFKVTDRAGTRWIQAGFVGAPDIIGMTTKGRFVAIECKRPRGGVVSAEQLEFLQCVRAGGGIGIIARSVDDVIDALR